MNRSSARSFIYLMAGLLNLFLPGVGLILLRREWFGLTISMLFAAFCNMMIAGAVIAPEAIPAWLTWTAGAGAVGVWFLAQAAMRRRKADLHAIHSRIDVLIQEAERAIEAGDIAAARRALEFGLSLDTEHPLLHSRIQRVSVGSTRGGGEPVREAR